MKVDLGDLTAEGPIAGRAWRLSSRDAALGYLYPVLQQGREAPVWVATTEAASPRSARATRDGGRHGTRRRHRPGSQHALAAAQPLPHRLALLAARPARRRRSRRRPHRLDRRPVPLGRECRRGRWWLESIFHYLLPTVGGRTGGDEPLNLDAVPQYHRRGAAWVDRTASLGVACWFPADPDFWVRYWKDPDGNCHPDLFRTVKQELRPGQRIDVNGPLAFFFPLRDLTRDGFVARSWTLERDVMQAP